MQFSRCPSRNMYVDQISKILLGQRDQILLKRMFLLYICFSRCLGTLSFTASAPRFHPSILVFPCGFFNRMWLFFGPIILSGRAARSFPKLNLFFYPLLSCNIHFYRAWFNFPLTLIRLFVTKFLI